MGEGVGLSGTEKTGKVLSVVWAKETMATSVPSLGRLQRDKVWDMLHQWQGLQHLQTGGGQEARDGLCSSASEEKGENPRPAPLPLV